MGLSGRKVKQRIGNDPRNLSWADDASRFGQSYLEKFGWDTSKGLGASGEGRTNAIKMSQKLDMLGIGMQRNQNDPNGIAWRQNRDFENLLQRLNEGTEAIGPFHKARESSPIEGEEVAAETVNSADDADATKREKKTKKQKKRKASLEEEEAESSVRDKKERKKRKKSKSAVPEDDVSSSPDAQATAAPAYESPIAPIAAPAPVRALPRAHRARNIAAKRMAASNSVALAEILGIPSSSSTTAITTASPSPLTTATATTTTTTTIPTLAITSDPHEEDSLQILTTATQSVGDYLRAKIDAKAAAQPWSNKNSTIPLPPVTRDADRDRDDDDVPRAGLGAARLVLTGPLDEPVYVASKFAAMFARGQASVAKEEEADRAGETHEDGGGAGDGEDQSSSARRRAKEERRKKKEERRRKKEAKSRAIAEPDAKFSNDVPVEEPSIGEARPAKRKKHRESEGLDGLLEGNPAPSDGRMVVVPNKMQRKRDKRGRTRTLDD